jgi:hypothetical protein
VRCVAMRDTNGRVTATLLAAYPSLLAGLVTAYARLDAAAAAWAGSAQARAAVHRSTGSSRRPSAAIGIDDEPLGPSFAVPADVEASVVFGAVLEHLLACLKLRRASAAALDSRHAAVAAASAVIGCFAPPQQLRLLRALLAAAGIRARQLPPQPRRLQATGSSGFRLLRQLSKGSGGLTGGGSSRASVTSTGDGDAFSPSTPVPASLHASLASLAIFSPVATASSTPVASASAPMGSPQVPPTPMAALMVHAAEGPFELADAHDATWRDRVLLCRRFVVCCLYLMTEDG